MGRPIWPWRFSSIAFGGEAWVMSMAVSAPGGSGQDACQHAPRQRDLEIVVALAARALQHGIGSGVESALLRGLARERPFRLRHAPRLVREAAECEPRATDASALRIDDGRDRDQRERVRS